MSERIIVVREGTKIMVVTEDTTRDQLFKMVTDAMGLKPDRRDAIVEGVKALHPGVQSFADEKCDDDVIKMVNALLKMRGYQ